MFMMSETCQKTGKQKSDVSVEGSMEASVRKELKEVWMAAYGGGPSSPERVINSEINLDVVSPSLPIAARGNKNAGLF